jgi:hypothetical protein
MILPTSNRFNCKIDRIITHERQAVDKIYSAGAAAAATTNIAAKANLTRGGWRKRTSACIRCLLRILRDHSEAVKLQIRPKPALLQLSHFQDFLKPS